jgi:LemA protein
MMHINVGDFITMATILFLAIIALVVLVAFYNMYVSLIKKRNKVKEAMGGIDVQLNKRYSLIPNILTIAERFMEHEKELFSGITELRTRAASLKATDDTIQEKIKLDNEISSKMSQLLVNVENYPQLKSDQTMVQAMQTYAEVEEHIAAARRFYNSAVNDLNNSAEIFPSSLVAGMIGIKSYPFFEASDEARKEINAADYLKK